MNPTKYIVYRDRSSIERMVIFSSLDIHRDRARGLGMVVSAGFISVGEGVRCFGESESLGVKSRLKDTQIARWMFGWEQDHPGSDRDEKEL